MICRSHEVEIDLSDVASKTLKSRDVSGVIVHQRVGKRHGSISVRYYRGIATTTRSYGCLSPQFQFNRSTAFRTSCKTLESLISIVSSIESGGFAEL